MQFLELFLAIPNYNVRIYKYARERKLLETKSLDINNVKALINPNMNKETATEITLSNGKTKNPANVRPVDSMVQDSLSFFSFWIFRRQIIAAINLRLIEPNTAYRCLLPAKSISHYKSIGRFLSFRARSSRTSSR